MSQPPKLTNVRTATFAFRLIFPEDSILCEETPQGNAVYFNGELEPRFLGSTWWEVFDKGLERKIQQKINNLK